MIHSKRSEPRSVGAGPGNLLATAPRAGGRGLSRWTALATIALVFGSTNRAYAEGGTTAASVPDPLATSLFQEAVALLEKGEWKEGCAKFDASFALFQAPSTLLNIARCHEHEGKLSLAWAAYQRALVLNLDTPGAARKQELEEVAKKGLAEVEPRLPRLKIVLKGVAPTGLRVTQNGKDVPAAGFGVPIPVDPGPQSVVAEAPDFEPFTQTATVKEGELVEIPIDLKKRVVVSVIDKPVETKKPLWPWISAGAGIALLAGAAAFRVDQAFVEGKQVGKCNDDLKDGCPFGYDPKPDNDRKNLDNGMFVAFGTIGVIGLGAAIAGFVMTQPTKPAPKKTAVVTPWVGPTGVGLGVGGRF